MGKDLNKSEEGVVCGGEDYRIVDAEILNPQTGGAEIWTGWKGITDSLFCPPHNANKRVIGISTGIRDELGRDRMFDLRCADCTFSFAHQEVVILADSKYHLFHCDVCNILDNNPFKWIQFTPEERERLLIRLDFAAERGPIQ